MLFSVVVGFLVWVWGIWSLAGNDISLVPLGLEVNGSLIPFSDSGWDLVHGINSFHEGDQDSSSKEVDKCIIISDFTLGSIAFELGYVVSKG